MSKVIKLLFICIIFCSLSFISYGSDVQVGSLNMDSTQDSNAETATNEKYNDNLHTSIDANGNNNMSATVILEEQENTSEDMSEAAGSEDDFIDDDILGSYSSIFRCGILNESDIDGYLICRADFTLDVDTPFDRYIDLSYFVKDNPINSKPVVWTGDTTGYFIFEPLPIKSNEKVGLDFDCTRSFGQGTLIINFKFTLIPKNLYNDMLDAFILMEGQRSNILSTLDNNTGFDEPFRDNCSVYVYVADEEGNLTNNTYRYEVPYKSIFSEVKDKISSGLDLRYKVIGNFTDSYGNLLTNNSLIIKPLLLTPSFKDKCIVDGQTFNTLIKECIKDGLGNNVSKQFARTSNSYDFTINRTDVKLYDISVEQDMSTVMYKDLYGVYWQSKYDRLIFNPDASHMFEELDEIVFFQLVDVDTVLCKYMSCMFANCKNAVEIDVSKFNTSNVENMSYMFYMCSSVGIIDVSEFTTKNVIYAQSLFQGCSKLVSLNVHNWDVSNIIDAHALFGDCEELLSLDLSNWNLDKVENVYWLFGNCKKLTMIDLSNSNFDNCKITQQMFYCCYTLQTIELNSSVTFNSVTNAENMFRSCYELNTIDTSNFIFSKCENVSYMFANCYKISKIDLTSFNSVSVINAKSMFHTCIDLSALAFGSNCTFIKCENAELMFNTCRKLETLDISMFDMRNNKSMYGMFYHMESLKSINFSSMSTISCINMQEVFNGCYELTSIDVSMFNTKSCQNFQWMFAYCKKLTSIKYGSDFINNGNYNMYQMYISCPGNKVGWYHD